jgi:hypothetical protein
MRFNYRPENPLYLLFLRAYRLGKSVIIENTPAYAGCKSWVPLGDAVEIQNAQPVLSDSQYSARVEQSLRRISAV